MKEALDYIEKHNIAIERVPGHGKNKGGYYLSALVSESSAPIRGAGETLQQAVDDFKQAIRDEKKRRKTSLDIFNESAKKYL